MSFIKQSMVGVLLSSLCALPVYAAQKETIHFKNQRGSTMTLVWDEKGDNNTGTLTGTFTTAVGSCKPDVGVPQALTGYFNGNVLAMTVNFPHCKKVAAMTANISDDKTKMHAMWLVGNHANDPTGKDWDSNIVGMDTYHRIK